jgi:hypothetical protein
MGEPQGIVTGAAADLEQLRTGREGGLQRGTNRAPLLGDAEPGLESPVEVGSNGVEGGCCRRQFARNHAG